MTSTGSKGPYVMQKRGELWCVYSTSTPLGICTSRNFSSAVDAKIHEGAVNEAYRAGIEDEHDRVLRRIGDLLNT